MGFRKLFRNLFAVNCITAVFGRQESRSCSHIGHQLHIGHGNHGVDVGAAGLNLDLDCSSGFKLLAEAAVCCDRGIVHQDLTIAYHDGIVKGQRSLCGLVVGNRQSRTIVAAAAATCPWRRPNLADDTGSGCVPRIVRTTCEAQADIFIA